MDQESRAKRLAADLEALRAIKEASTILDFEPTGDPPDRYTIVFRGKGVSRDTSRHADVKYVEVHRCDIRLPYSYPARPPDIRWLTPIFHPNISFSGFITLSQIGLWWEKDLGLDAVCERLWDVARLAYVDLDKAANYAAKNWFEGPNDLRTPVDPRPLRDKMGPASSNVVRYQRRGESRFRLNASNIEGDVLYIGEDTPTPELPRPKPRVRRDDDEIFYIGDDREAVRGRCQLRGWRRGVFRFLSRLDRYLDVRRRFGINVEVLVPSFASKLQPFGATKGRRVHFRRLVQAASRAFSLRRRPRRLASLLG